MAIDTRHWYIDKLRKLTGYTERARFRVSLGAARRRRERLVGWVQLLLGFGAASGLAVAVLLLARRWLEA